MNLEKSKKIKEIKDELSEKYKLAIKDLSITAISEDNINIDVLATNLIDLPYKSYVKQLQQIDLLRTNQLILNEKKIVEDDMLGTINKDTELKNQAQRDAKQRQLLQTNDFYNDVEECVLISQQLKLLLSAQINYYDNLLSGIKYRYKQMCNLLLADQKLQDVVNNE